jgi:hypothetical protein
MAIAPLQDASTPGPEARPADEERPPTSPA